MMPLNDLSGITNRESAHAVRFQDRIESPLHSCPYCPDPNPVSDLLPLLDPAEASANAA